MIVSRSARPPTAQSPSGPRRSWGAAQRRPWPAPSPRLSAMRRAVPLMVCLATHLGAPFAPPASAQPANPEDANINALRGLTSISPVDQTKFERWIVEEISLAEAAVARSDSAANQFRDRFQAQVKNPANSAAFVTQFVTSAGSVAAQRMSSPNLNWRVAHALAVELADLKRKEVLPGLLAGLNSPAAAVRAVCARGLDDLKSVLATDPPRLTQVIQALQSAGVAEQSPHVLSRIYLALGYSAQQSFGQVFDAYLAILDARLQSRVASAAAPDGAEIPAFEFLADPSVAKQLNPAQKAALASKVAVFLRLDAARYNAPVLSHDEQDRIERLLSAEEEILESCVGPNPQAGKIRGLLEQGGWSNRQAIQAEVAKWIGDAASNTPGVLNAAPWNVPIGAP